MFKIFRNIGLITLIIASFMYTEKLVSVVKEYDDIMVEIKQNKDKYKTESIEATIKDNTIIPGIRGKEIDINKSYYRMKQYGKFDERLLVYKKSELANPLKDNLGKFIISGNNKKNMVSLIFIINNNDNINDILKKVNSKNIKVNFFIDNEWANNNEKMIVNLVKEKYIVGNLSRKDSEFLLLDNVIKNLAHQKISYCYTEDYDKKILKTCSKQNNYTIVPNIVVEKNGLSEIKKKIQPGSIISLSDMDDTTLEVIINYIQNKGYEIVTLDKLLEE